MLLRAASFALVFQHSFYCDAILGVYLNRKLSVAAGGPHLTLSLI